MNKKVLYCIGIVIAVCIIFMLPNISHANEDVLYTVTMDIELSKDGSAKVSEVWDINITSGTELFKQYNNLETSTISDFSVTENGKEFTTLSKWDTSASRDDKNYKCGLNKTNNGVELCWGIGEYGRHEYVLKYTITNFVYELNNSQVSNFILVPDLEDLAPKYVKIKVNSFYKFNEDNTKIKLKGFSGNSSINDGVIEIYSTGTLQSGNYVNTDFTFKDEKFSLSKSLVPTNNETTPKNNSKSKKVFVTLCGVFGLFIIANVAEERKRKKKEIAIESDETK